MEKDSTLTLRISTKDKLELTRRAKEKSEELGFKISVSEYVLSIIRSYIKEK